MIRLGQTGETNFLEVRAKEVNGETPSKMVTVDLKLHRSKDGQLYWTFEVTEEEK